MIRKTHLAIAAVLLASPARLVAGDADAVALVKKHLSTLKAEPAEVKLIGEEASQPLEGATIDLAETPEGTHLVVTKANPPEDGVGGVGRHG